MLTAKRLRELIHYDPCTGVFTWRYNRIGGVAAGQRADSLNDPRGYRRATLDQKRMMAHRAAWLYVYGVMPSGQIDHVNGDKKDNRISNLRPATQSQNKANAPRYRNNQSGFKGVECDGNRWKASIRRNRKLHYLGMLSTPHEAHLACLRAAREMFGAFANAG